MFDSELLGAALRTVVYAGTIAAAGSQLVSWSLPGVAGSTTGALNRQTRIGLALLIVAEPVRILMFQVAIAAGDAGLAMTPNFLAMGLEMPAQRASVVRLLSAFVLLWSITHNKSVARVAAITMFASYVLEGHTAAETPRVVYAGLLFVHVALVHWWLAALYPILAQARVQPIPDYRKFIDAFSRLAMVIVPLLIAAGALLFASLIDWQLDVTQDYQFRFGIKVGLVMAIVAIAVRNKLWLTPRLTEARGAVRMRRSIGVEICVGLAILVATAWILRTGPDHDHHGDGSTSFMLPVFYSAPQHA